MCLQWIHLHLTNLNAGTYIGRVTVYDNFLSLPRNMYTSNDSSVMSPFYNLLLLFSIELCIQATIPL